MPSKFAQPCSSDCRNSPPVPVRDVFSALQNVSYNKDYMAGNDFTLVDIYYIPLIQRLFACGYEDIIVSREAVSAWWDRCVNRRAIQRMLASDKEEAAVAASTTDRIKN